MSGTPDRNVLYIEFYVCKACMRNLIGMDESP